MKRLINYIIGRAAVGTPYMALMIATGPPPNFLTPVITAGVLLIGLRALDGGESRWTALAAAGLAA